MIGYKKVGDCIYPTLTGHTLRRKNIKLIQFVKAIKSNVVNDRKLNNSTIDRNVDNEIPSNKIILDENTSKDINVGSDSSSVDAFADGGGGREERGSSSSSSSSSQLHNQKNIEEKNVIKDKQSEVKEAIIEEGDKSYDKIYKHCGPVSELLELENITHSASEEFNCVLDVD